MISCMKVSCVVYWIAGFYYAAYMFSSSLFVAYFIPVTPEVTEAEFFVFLICVANLFFCIAGCAFVKCDVVHIILAFCYTAPFVTVNVFGTMYGFRSVDKAWQAFPVLTNPAENFQKTYLPREWFEGVQRRGMCCGYWGFWDHAGFLSPNPVNPNIDEFGHFLPKECCRLVDEEGLCRSWIDVLPFEMNATSNLPTSRRKSKDQPKLKPIRMNFTELIDWADCPFPEAEEELLVEYYKDYTGVFSFNASIQKLINVCGCYTFMKGRYESVYESSHYLFFVTNIIMNLTMLLVYFYHWYVVRLRKARGKSMRRRRRRSTHTLATISSDDSEDDEFPPSVASFSTPVNSTLDVASSNSRDSEVKKVQMEKSEPAPRSEKSKLKQ